VQPSLVANGPGDFRAIYAKHYGFVWHALHRFGVPADQIDDALQEVFVTVHRRRFDFDGRSTKAWLYGIARRTASNHRRASRRSERRTDAVRAVAESHPESASRAYDALQILDRYLETLGDDERELFILSELEGMTGPEIALARGENLNTTYSRIRKLRLEFADRVSDEPLEHVRRSRPRATKHSWLVLSTSLGTSPTLALGWVTSIGGATLFAAAAGLGMSVAIVTADAHAPANPRNDAPPIITGHRGAIESSQEAPAPLGDLVAPAVTNDDHTMKLVRPSPPSVLVHRTVDVTSPAIPMDADLLAEENGLLLRAMEEIRTGSPFAALQTTSQHAAKFPESDLGDLRIALRIEALCGAGKRAQARGESLAFIRDHVDSPLTDRIRHACAESTQNLAKPDNPGT